jgi:hypothetical protein
MIVRYRCRYENIDSLAAGDINFLKGVAEDRLSLVKVVKFKRKTIPRSLVLCVNTNKPQGNESARRLNERDGKHEVTIYS